MIVPPPLRIAAVLLPILLAGTGAAAVTGPPPGEHTPRGEYLIDVWQVEDGLPRNQIQAMVRTRDGYVWLGTSAGLVRFDGIRFTTFNQGQLKVNNVHALLQDREGRLWIGTYGAGLYVYDHGRFTAIGPADGLKALRIRALFEDRQGRLWVGTNEEGVSVREGTRFRTLRTGDGLPNDTVRVVYQTPDEKIWIGTNARGLACWESGRMRAYGVKPGPLSAYGPSEASVDDNVLDLWQDPAGTLWIATDADGLWHLAGGRITPFSPPGATGRHGVRRLLPDSSGALWAGTDGGGLWRLEGGRFEGFATRDGLPSDLVQAVMEDPGSGVWVGTRDGLARLRRRAFTTVGVRQGLTNGFVTAVVGSRGGGLWVGTRAGLHRVDGERVTARPVFPQLVNTMVLSLLEDRAGTLWVGTREGLWRVRGDEVVRVEAAGLRSRYISALAEDGNGDVWIGTRLGLARFRNGIVTYVPGTEDLPSLTAILATADGSVWAGTEEAGLARVQGGRCTKYDRAGGLPDAAVTGLYDDGGDLWIATLGGLARMHDGRLRAYTRDDGLPSASLVSVVDDGRGSLWMGTFGGVVRVDRRSFDTVGAGGIATLRTTLYDKSDGMPTGETSRPGQTRPWRDLRGRLWFPTVSGLAVVDPARVPLDTEPPQVVIEELRADDVVVSSSAPASLPSGIRRFAFRYTAFAFAAPDKIRFRYKLEGYDPDWIDAGTQRVAYYTSVPPRTYRFRVKAGNRDGVWNDAGASVDFALAAPFYRLPLFWAAIALAGAALAFALHRLHLRQVRAQFAAVTTERGRMAREIHDTLAQGFVGIGIQLETAAKLQATSAEQAREHLDRARILVRSSLADARRTVWALRAETLEEHDLAGALDLVARQLSGDHDVKVRVSGPRRRLPAEVENNLLRIGQEALANAARHAHADEIAVDLRFEEGVVRLSVRDDGCGFDVEHAAQAASGHFGLAGIRERVHNLGGELSLLSRPGRGSEVVVEVPVA
jgi:ligand-binding sensor domain-containing protein/signal transduction histidine kinase